MNRPGSGQVAGVMMHAASHRTGKTALGAFLKFSLPFSLMEGTTLHQLL
jgi:hypothetical protein